LTDRNDRRLIETGITPHDSFARNKDTDGDDYSFEIYQHLVRREHPAVLLAINNIPTGVPAWFGIRICFTGSSYLPQSSQEYAPLPTGRKCGMPAALIWSETA